MEFERNNHLFKQLFEQSNAEQQIFTFLSDCQKNQKKFVDPFFYPELNPNEEDEKLLESAEWKRVEDEYPDQQLFDNVTSGNIGQGNLSDCYLITALIYLSHYPDTVKQLFHPKSSLKDGIVVVNFVIMGELFPVIVDTQLPFTNGKPIFARSNKDHLSPAWFALIEKAYAKACGGYSKIQFGQAHIAVHHLLDWYGDQIDDMNIITDHNSIFQALSEKRKQGALLSSSVSLNRFVPGTTEAQVMKGTGLIPSHAYQILDVREAESKQFVQLRNPWGKFEWNGEFSNKSKAWTPSLKQALGYANNNDGCFWMLFTDFYRYFRDLSYSLPREKNWSKKSVCGVIKGYLDCRSACSGCKNAGCLPQWAVHFSKPGTARIHVEISGPHAFHGLNVVYNKGRKVQTITADLFDCSVRDANNCQINGIEYKVTQIESPYTVFIDRSDGSPGGEDDPSYFRIIVEFPFNFTINPFNDDFRSMHCVSDSGVFRPGNNDGWDPYKGKEITTCRQWYFKFLRPTTLHVRCFKTLSQKRHDIILGYTNQKIKKAYTKLTCQHFYLNAISDYEEVHFDIDKVDKSWVLCIYREKADDVSKFKFIACCEDSFEFGELPATEGSVQKEEAEFDEIDIVEQPENFAPTSDKKFEQSAYKIHNSDKVANIKPKKIQKKEAHNDSVLFESGGNIDEQLDSDPEIALISNSLSSQKKITKTKKSEANPPDQSQCCLII